jgi:hypothetical protein
MEAYEPLERILRAGWLEKRPVDNVRRALPLSGWRRRWFELTPTALVWRSGPGHPTKGRLLLADALAVPAVSTSALQRPSTSQHLRRSARARVRALTYVSRISRTL